jgi:HK97 family phage prohead protease
MTGPAHNVERRAAMELRAVSGRRLAGYAATWNSEAKIGSFTETITRGAFAASLASGKDILALVDHQPTALLARTGSGTLRLSEDARGLAFEIDVPQTTLGNDVLALAERGDLGGMSFGFRTVAEAWPARDRRELRAVDLVEISIVQAFPAYGETEIVARAHGADLTAARLRKIILETIG